jgi:hypothetical protein
LDCQFRRRHWPGGLFLSRASQLHRLRAGDLTNKSLNLTILEGVAPLATNGICQWLADTNDNGYQIIGGPGTTSSSGNYTYTRTGPDRGLIAFQDSLAGTVNQQLVFTSPQAGCFYTTNAAGFEAGTFTMADGPVEFLGHMKFTPDTVRAGSLYSVPAARQILRTNSCRIS